MTNREISSVLSQAAKLMELHGENEFKARSLQNAAIAIGKLEINLSGCTEAEMEQLKGVGKSISRKIIQILETGSFDDLIRLLGQTPPGVAEMMQIKGIGPKKVAVLWNELGVESPGELLYACNENRLVSLKGFGIKTQEQIKKAIEYSFSNRGLYHFATLEEVAEEITEALSSIKSISNISVTGQVRRKCETASEIGFVIEPDENIIMDAIRSHHAFSNYQCRVEENNILFTSEGMPAVRFYFTGSSQSAITLFKTTGSTGHISLLEKISSKPFPEDQLFDDEVSIYKYFGFPFIHPECREGLHELSDSSLKKLDNLIRVEDLRGCLHNHSLYSDGANTIKEMAEECIRLGYAYFGICDHSKSAFYANGLSEEKVRQQHDEIDKLNRELAPFVIFKGIESDILPDGSLDYDDHVLASFDFIVASVHSVLKMTEEKATARLIKAISNPYTTILGHPTGRLLLAREGYPVNHEKVIDACADNGVVIELNAHPYRLDLDWRWIRYATDKGVMISINPDAHQVSGIRDMYYGVCAARKGMLTKNQTFNALNLETIMQWFSKRRDKQ